MPVRAREPEELDRRVAILRREHEINEETAGVSGRCGKPGKPLLGDAAEFAHHEAVSGWSANCPGLAVHQGAHADG
jgi:hypothetical protein